MLLNMETLSLAELFKLFVFFCFFLYIRENTHHNKIKNIDTWTQTNTQIDNTRQQI